MNDEDWAIYRELEKKLASFEYQIIRLHESNANLHRINGFIFSALLLEIVAMLYMMVGR